MAQRVSPDELVRLGGKLRGLREDLGMSQAEVARRLGMTEGGYGHFERGRRIPSAAELPWLSRGYGVSVEELLTRLGLADQRILDEPLPDALSGRLQRIVSNWPTLNESERETVAQLLTVVSNFGREICDSPTISDNESDISKTANYNYTRHRNGFFGIQQPGRPMLAAASVR